MTKMLEEGQYILPDNLTIERVGKYVTIRPKVGFIKTDRCGDCKYFGHGQATNGGYTTTVCKKQPKKNGLYYNVGNRRFPCANFEKMEEQQ